MYCFAGFIITLPKEASSADVVEDTSAWSTHHVRLAGYDWSFLIAPGQ